MAPSRVLAEMRELGITATELGAIGWLPTEVDELRSMLGAHSMQLVGGFVPLVLHDATQRDQARSAAVDAAGRLAAAGGECFVTAVVASPDHWERLQLNAPQWHSVVEGLLMVEEICAAHGLRQVVHPHVDTLIETSADVDRFLADTDVSFCLDTGHLFIGGADPVLLARKYAERVGLVHIKDVDMKVADRLLDGELSLMAATQAGLFPAAGCGHVPIAATIEALDASGYRGWYVLEQDVALTDGEPPLGEGPKLDVQRSVEYLRSLAA
jgi:inosose dehydratase